MNTSSFLSDIVRRGPVGRFLRRRIYRGFTLIELLVVIAIVAILAALLLPAIKSAKDKGMQAHCINNLQQFGIAYSLYTNDYDGWFPPGGARAGEHSSRKGWINTPNQISYDANSNVTGGSPSRDDIRQGLLWPYLKNYEVYQCPGDKNRKIRLFSYSQNAAYQNPDPALVNYVGRSRDRIGMWLTKVMLMCEEQRPDDGCFWYQNSGAVDSRDCLAYDRHVQCTNLLFGDGHVKGVWFKSANEAAKLRDIGCFPGDEDQW